MPTEFRDFHLCQNCSLSGKEEPIAAVQEQKKREQEPLQAKDSEEEARNPHILFGPWLLLSRAALSKSRRPPL